MYYDCVLIILKIKKKNGRTPLHYACSHGLYETVEYLIESGADINAATDVNSS